MTESSGKADLTDLFERNVHCLLGLPFDAVDLAGAVSRMRSAAVRRESCFLSTPNLNFLVACLSDRAFRESVIESDLSVADGTPIVWIASLLGAPIRERVAGSTVFERLRGEKLRRISVYFFGGAEGVAEAACDKLNASSTGLVCVGHACPGFGSVAEMSSDETIAKINGSGADFVVVSLGARKGQAWIMRNRHRLSAPIISHLGAVMNFVAGTVRRAPPWVQRLGLEWVWRVKEEPRLWSRYLVDGIEFLTLLVTRVLPHMMLLRRHEAQNQNAAACEIRLHDCGGEIAIFLSGAWAYANLGPLRECFAQVVRDGRNIRLEMENVTFVDSAFIGLVMLLYGELKRRGRRLRTGSAGERVRRIFWYACAEFLLEAR